MVKIEKSSHELNRFLSRVYISSEHAASFTGLDKLYNMVKNQFPSLTRKEIRKWGNLSYSLYKPSRRTFKRNKVCRRVLLKLNLILNLTPENRPHHSNIELQPYIKKLNTH